MPATRYPCCYCGQYFVGDGVGPLREVLDTYLVVARGADEDCLVTVEGTCCADVDHCLVHADSPDNVMEVVVDDDLGLVGECAPVAICITDWEGDDSGWMCWCPSTAVANWASCLNDLEIDVNSKPYLIFFL